MWVISVSDREHSILVIYLCKLSRILTYVNSIVMFWCVHTTIIHTTCNTPNKIYTSATQHIFNTTVPGYQTRSVITGTGTCTNIMILTFRSRFTWHAGWFGYQCTLVQFHAWSLGWWTQKSYTRIVCWIWCTGVVYFGIWVHIMVDASRDGRKSVDCRQYQVGYQSDNFRRLSLMDFIVLCGKCGSVGDIIVEHKNVSTPRWLLSRHYQYVYS